MKDGEVSALFTAPLMSLDGLFVRSERGMDGGLWLFCCKSTLLGTGDQFPSLLGIMRRDLRDRLLVQTVTCMSLVKKRVENVRSLPEGWASYILFTYFIGHHIRCTLVRLYCFLRCVYNLVSSYSLELICHICVKLVPIEHKKIWFKISQK